MEGGERRENGWSEEWRNRRRREGGLREERGERVDGGRREREREGDG